MHYYYYYHHYHHYLVSVLPFNNMAWSEFIQFNVLYENSEVAWLFF
jgi:hypothetical protein